MHSLPVIKAVSFVGSTQFKTRSNQKEFQKYFENEILDTENLSKYAEHASRKAAHVMFDFLKCFMKRLSTDVVSELIKTQADSFIPGLSPPTDSRNIRSDSGLNSIREKLRVPISHSSYLDSFFEKFYSQEYSEIGLFLTEDKSFDLLFSPIHLIDSKHNLVPIEELESYISPESTSIILEGAAGILSPCSGPLTALRQWEIDYLQVPCSPTVSTQIGDYGRTS